MTNNGVVVTNFNLSGDYPDDTTNIQLIATESCLGLADTLNVVFVVTGVSMNITCTKTYPELPVDLMITESVYDHAHITQGCVNGNPSAQIVASYSNIDIYDTLRTYTCADLPNAPIGITIYFWYVGDVAPFTFCNSLVGLQNAIPPMCTTPPTRIAGTIETENGQAVPSVAIALDGSNMPNVNTAVNGKYAFPEMPGGGTYDVIPSRDDHPLEGVSTLDLIYIQKHILGSELLSSPYKMIAADVNNDEKITAGDIVQLRKLILGINTKFSNNTSWRMVDKSYKFPDASNPFIGLIAENYHIPYLNADMNIDWVGVKTGDVNGSYVTNVNSNKSNNRSAKVQFEVKEQTLIEGRSVVPVYASEDITIDGFQISLPVQNVNDVHVTNGSLAINDDQYSFVDGLLNIAWHQNKSAKVNKGDLLFFLHVDAKYNNQLSHVLLTDVRQGLNPEMYHTNGSIQNIGWRLLRDSNQEFALHGNTPNPWSQETNINFTLPEDGIVSLKVRDITGRIVYVGQNYFNKGDNSFKLSSDILGASGILFYDLTFGNEVKTMKMLNIK